MSPWIGRVVSVDEFELASDCMHKYSTSQRQAKGVNERREKEKSDDGLGVDLSKSTMSCGKPYTSH